MNRKQALATLIALALPWTALAQGTEPNFPTKAITIVVPFPPGGSPDVLARVIGDKLSARWGQPVVVENRPGASGVTGAQHVMRATPDGHTLLMTPNTFVLAPLVMSAQAANYDPQADFAPVALPSKTVLVLAAHPRLGVKNMAELVRLGKDRPITYTGSGNGSPQHIAGEMLRQAAGLNLTFVPHRGLAPALADTVAGHIDLVFVPYGAAAGHLKGGALVGLGTLDEEPQAATPGLQPLARQGYPDLVVSVWSGLFAPKGTPPAVIARLDREIKAVLQMPDVRARLEQSGQIITAGGPEELAGAVKRDLASFTPIVRANRIKAE
ncbi:tripartite tricarboxylate transporter substrate binding protein [Ramlibacter sp. AW1]|uniref:Tripartite tricarboxylate transporter substrate binding protein n=1 Tax=Ramlibacter aurantiacus TaxID=2801330 RepID=A0A936ZST0_9BURK|nr:tripartite tricarboxylate transporter substrate binding protein [Ramlibacter aurantiacus]MBL0422980.1 tripartite tricarboxylate transporter substrate binding protein [Ramlibacter aurantiacus]